MTTESAQEKTILVTGGSGLVGHALQWAVAPDRRHPLFGHKDNEQWVFVSSRDADLRFATRHPVVPHSEIMYHTANRRSR